MLPYLTKLTMLWAVFLLAYELLFKQMNVFKANRLYLFVAMLSGIFIPLIPLPIGSDTPQYSNIATLSYGIQQVNKIEAISNSQPSSAIIKNPVNVVESIYILGLVFFLIMTLKEVVTIIRRTRNGQFTIVNGFKIFESKKLHAPFSFMGRIFISHPQHYSSGELHFILKHEAAHNSRYHWLDMILMQLIFIVFWFHPLIWRFRYLLKITHEFEADQMASAGNEYEYGHFLLTQTLLKGTPVIAHSFHFSPIKIRITMLTQKRKTNPWKYVLTVPILLSCTLLFAKSANNNKRERVGDITTFNGHKIYWGKPSTDTVIAKDPKTGHEKALYFPNTGYPYKLDNDSLFRFKQEVTQYKEATLKNTGENASEYITKKFKEQVSDALDSISQIAIYNVIVDAGGKIRYYEIGYRGRHFSDKQSDANPILDPIVNGIVENCPPVETAGYGANGKPIYIGYLGFIVLNNSSGRAFKMKL